MINLLIDCQCLLTASRFRGIGNVCRNIIHGLARNKTEYESIKLLFNADTDGYEYLTKEFPEIEKNNIIPFVLYSSKINYTHIGTKEYMASELLYISAVAKSKCNILLIPSLFEVNSFFIPPINKLKSIISVVSIVHDYIPFCNIDLYLTENSTKVSYSYSLEMLAASDIILAISEYVKNRTEYLVPNGNIKKLLWGGYPEQTEAEEECQVNNLKQREFIFYSGGSDERKNITSLLKAYSLCSDTIKSSYKLVIAAGNSDYVEKLKKKAKKLLGSSYKRCLVLGYISGNEMKWLYKNCILFVFPSFSEGFGLTILEAMQQNAPVICSKTTSMPEVHGYYSDAEFDPYNVEDIRDKIEYWCTEKNNSILREHSKKQANVFSWIKTADCLTGYLKNLPEKKEIQIDTEEYILKNASFLFPEIKDREKFACLFSVLNFKTIYFDISCYIHHTGNKTGIQRVVAEFIKFASSVLDDYYDFKCIAYKGVYRVVNITETGEPEFYEKVHPIPGDYYVSIDLCANTIVDNIDDLIKWQKNGCILCACVYDLVYSLYPQYVRDSNTVRFLNRWLNTVLVNFDRILCISNAVLNEITEYIKQHNIVNKNLSLGYFHLGSDINTNICPGVATLSDVIQIKDLGRTNFIAVSTIEPRKGYCDIIDAFEKSLASNLNANLIIVGRPGWKCDDITSRIKGSRYFNKNIFWFSDCNDDKLLQLYSVSDCYIAASYYEGFGLGAVEAANYNLPCILRDIPVFREVGEENAIYFNDINELTSDFLYFSENKRTCSKKIIRTLTWKESVQMAFDFLLKQ